MVSETKFIAYNYFYYELIPKKENKTFIDLKDQEKRELEVLVP